jgi:molybdopterin-guanine dinucleotide biosynthesis protein A
VESLLASGLAAQYVVCPCDMPCVTAALIAVLAAPGKRDATVLRVAGEREARSLPARFSAHALETVSAALGAGRRSVRDLLREVDAEVREIPSEWAPLLRNVNDRKGLRDLGH